MVNCKIVGEIELEKWNAEKIVQLLIDQGYLVAEIADTTTTYKYKIIMTDNTWRK